MVQWQLVLKALWWLLRVFAYAFHLALALFLIGVGLVALSSGTTLTLGMLPWEGVVLTRMAVFLGAAGILCVALAVTGAARWLFPLWTLFVLIMMLRGFFLSSYTFSGESEFKSAVWMTVGTVVAFAGSLSLFKRRRRA